MYLQKKSRPLIIIGLFIIAIGSLIMVGWLSGISILQQVIPGAVAMRFNTSLCFVLTAAALLAAPANNGGGSKLVFVLLSAIVTAFGLLTIAQDFFHFNAGIDQLFVTDPTPVSYNFPYPGRMAFNASVNFSLLGLGLLAYAYGRGIFKPLSQYLFHAATVLSAIALIGYLYGVSFFRVLFYQTSMATLTAILFFIISIAASLLNPGIGVAKLLLEKGVGNYMAKRLYLLIVAMIIVFGVISGQAQAFHGFSSLAVAVSILAVSFLLVTLLLVWNTANWLNRIDERRSEAEAKVMVLNSELEKRVEKRSEEFKKSEEKYRSLIEQASDAIYVLDFKGNFLDVNASMAQLVDYGEEELLRMNIRQVIDNEELKRDPLMQRMSELRKPGGHVIRERTFVRRDGTLFQVEMNVKLFDDDRIMVIARDITSRKKMEKEIREAELKFRTIAEKSMVGVYIVQHGTYSYVNPRFAHVFGYEADDLIGKVGVDTVIDDGYKHITLEYLRQRIEGLVESVHYEAKGKRKYGRSNWVEFYGSRADIGGVPTIIGSMIDITERKKAEDELRSSEIKYKLLFESNPMPMWMVARETGSIIAANEAAANHYGYTRDELLTMNVKALRPKGDLSGKSETHMAYKDYNSRREIIRHQKKNGTIIYVELLMHDIDFGGRPARLSLTLDVTEKLKAEELLRSSEANLQTILKTTDTAYALFDLGLQVITFNQKATEFVQQHYHRTPEKGDKLVEYFPESRFPQFKNYAAEVLKGKNISYEIDYPNGSGGVLWYDVRLFPITNDKKEILGLMMALYDITERKNAEQDLKNAYSRISNHIGRIKNMAWKQSHLIRSPLANLKGLTGMLKDNPSEEQVFEHMETELNRMDAIIIEMANEASVNEESGEW